MYPSNKKKKVWREEKERLLKMTLEERRKEYLRDYVPLSTILSWKEEMKSKGQNDEENTQETPQMKKSLSEKVSLYRGDITLLEVDAIVNAGFYFHVILLFSFHCYCQESKIVELESRKMSSGD
ncbi:ADP-ribose glycohydrolase MACROD2 isoform X11 [Meriones unguiculatus]|uniref:ADP-ribose glycohydrolase MACROD2 isoform X11 n=1 Tax=Meriones unguiculatus TaxID=10047 RepID=UPI00293F5DED|nr:ADP-ribose glycohydrolase MACROD2 isoform X11 [Meriones unguiculatus]